MFFKIPGHEIWQYAETRNLVTNYQHVNFKIYIYKTFPCAQFKHINSRNLQISKFLNAGYPKS